MTQVIPAEMTTLAEHEAVIERGLTTFIEVGTALLAIREGRLYRETHGTFEDYCRDRWGWTDNYARRLMAASEVAERIVPIGTVSPTAESQVRPLTSLPAAEQPAAWREAVTEAGGRVPTAGQVERIVRQRVVDAASPEYDDDFLDEVPSREFEPSESSRMTDAERFAAIVALLDAVSGITPREVRESHLEDVRRARKLAIESAA